MEIIKPKQVNIVITMYDSQPVLLIHDLDTNQGDIYQGDTYVGQFLNHILHLMKNGYHLNMIIDQQQNQKIIL